METSTQSQVLHRMLMDARKLAESGDPILHGFYLVLQARIELLISLLEREVEEADETAQP